MILKKVVQRPAPSMLAVSESLVKTPPLPRLAGIVCRQSLSGKVGQAGEIWTGLYRSLGVIMVIALQSQQTTGHSGL
ncbi:MAG: hypothetical protein P8017_06040 [Deltaproteobacteria bacterium]